MQVNGISISQCLGEIFTFIDLIKGIDIVNVLEIGMAHGGTLQLWKEFCKGKIIGIDFPKAEIFHEGNLDRFKHCYLLQGDSHDSNMILKVASILGGEKLGMLFIDGDHSLDGVTQDFAMYMPFVKHGGLIVFHDINNDNPNYKGYGQVKLLWEKLKKSYKYVEINHHFEWETGVPSVGIGVIINE